VVNRLAQFHPTKVLVEADFGDPKYAQRYRNYVAGKYALPANEVYQFGFKLAARAGNGTDKSANGKRINAFLMANFTKIKDPVFDAFLARQDAIERSGTYLDLLRYLNTDEAIRANAGSYSIFARPGDRVAVLMGQGHEYLLREFVRLNPNLVDVDRAPIFEFG